MRSSPIRRPQGASLSIRNSSTNGFALIRQRLSQRLMMERKAPERGECCSRSYAIRNCFRLRSMLGCLGPAPCESRVLPVSDTLISSSVAGPVARPRPYQFSCRYCSGPSPTLTHSHRSRRSSRRRKPTRAPAQPGGTRPAPPRKREGVSSPPMASGQTVLPTARLAWQSTPLSSAPPRRDASATRCQRGAGRSAYICRLAHRPD